MQLSKEEKQKITGEARSLFETVDYADTQVGIRDELEVEELFEEWREIVAEGENSKFERRLELDNLSRKEARKCLSLKKWPETEPLPSWIETVEELLDFIEAYDSKLTFEKASRDSHPFEDILWPLVVYARKTLQEGYGQYLHIFSDEALQSLEVWLLDRLTYISAFSLYSEFQKHLATNFPKIYFSDNPDSTEGYENFVESMLSGSFKDFFLEYPMLARITVLTIAQWIDSVSEFSRRINKDIDELNNTLLDSHSDTIADLNPGLSDSHNGGKTVIGVEFSSGEKVAYKPRDMSAEKAFFEFTSWLNEKGSPIQLKRINLLEKTGYGWMEWVDNHECETEEEVETYYRRTGRLLCLLYILNSTDFHFENIIASGDSPTPIDMELILNPDIFSIYIVEEEFLEDEIFTVMDSVVFTGLLPWSPFAPGEEKRPNLSGLNIGNIQKSGDEGIRWVNINQDNMSFEGVKGDFIPSKNVVKKAGEVHYADSHVEEIVSGFEEMYLYAMENEKELESRIESIFSKIETRIVFRTTRLYQLLLEKLRKPECLRSGLKYSLEIEKLTEPFLSEGSPSTEIFWPIYGYEYLDLRKRDVPKFTQKSDGDEIFAGEESVLTLDNQTGLEKVLERVKNLNDLDLKAQKQFIRLSLHYPQSESNPKNIHDSDVKKK